MDKKKYWSETDEEKRLCNEWLRDPLINPKTGHPIERGGPTYTFWLQKCKQYNIKKPKATGEITWRKCQAWLKNKEINPDTGRKIKIGGPKYKWLENECKKNDGDKPINLLGEYYIPDSKGFVPTIKKGESIYVVRKYDGRKVWGPLNKPCKGIELRYYKDTWDYKYNHYKPIFIGGSIKKPKQSSTHSKYNNTHSKYNNNTNTKYNNTHSKYNNKNNSKHIVDSILNLFM